MKEQIEKQAIEEMAKHCPCYIGEKCCIDNEMPERCDMVCQFGTYAEALYNAGYRKQIEGEWIWKSNGYKNRLHCSNCDRPNEADIQTDFCPKCGAKMKGSAE